MHNKRIVLVDGKAICNVDIFDTAAIQGFVKVFDNDTKEVTFINKSHIAIIENWRELTADDITRY